jgi:hypothetical protein
MVRQFRLAAPKYDALGFSALTAFAGATTDQFAFELCQPAQGNAAGAPMLAKAPTAPRAANRARKTAPTNKATARDRFRTKKPDDSGSQKGVGQVFQSGDQTTTRLRMPGRRAVSEPRKLYAKAAPRPGGGAPASGELASKAGAFHARKGVHRRHTT